MSLGIAKHHLVAGFLALGVALIGRSSAATTCVAPAADWSDFPSGYQCIVGVDHFIANHWGLPFPATGGHPSNSGCEALGACMEWVDNLPDGNTWNRHDWGSVAPQAYDVLIFPPHGSDGYGHAAMFDHEDGGTIYVMDDNWDGNMARSCSWAGHDGWVHSGTWTPYGFYRLKSLEPVVDQAPIGSLDTAACDSIGGWSQDPDDKAAHLSIDLYFDGPAGSGAPSLRITADQTRPDLCGPLGSCDHAFSMAPPLSLLDGAAHQVFAYGIDTAPNGNNPLLPGGPKSFTCAAPKPPFAPAIKRHIVNPDSLTAWQLSMLTDVAKYDQATADAITTGADETISPILARGDDGSAEIWVLDNGTRRHVTDPTSLAAWRFDASKASSMVAVTLYAMPEGPAWPAAPFGILAPSGAVYLADVPPYAPASSMGAGGSGGAHGVGGAAGSGGAAGGSIKATEPTATSHAGAGGAKSSAPLASGGSTGGAAAPSQGESAVAPVDLSDDKESGACSMAMSTHGTARSFGMVWCGLAAALLALGRRRRAA